MVKKRYWAFVLYPESAPIDWLEKLQLKGVSCAISPLHDKDINPTGEPKKPHYHIVLAYGNPTTYNNVKALTEELNCPIPIPLESCRGYYRYLTHKDNPEKYQYDEKDIQTLNAFDVTNILTNSEIAMLKIEIQKLIRENKIVEYADLMNILLDSELYELWNVASNNTVFFDRYIQSGRYSITKKEQTKQLPIIDKM